MRRIVVTCDVSHRSIGALNASPSNRCDMSVTCVTSHVLGSPWFFSPRQYSSIHVRSSFFVVGFGRWPGSSTCCSVDKSINVPWTSAAARRSSICSSIDFVPVTSGLSDLFVRVLFVRVWRYRGSFRVWWYHVLILF